jgi:CRAL/TRIO domain
LRLCFAATVAEAAASAADGLGTIIEVEISAEEYQKIQHFESLILAELNIQKMVVRGCDRQQRAIIIKLSRQGPWPTDRGDEAAHGYEIAHCYFAERGIATSEYMTRGQLPEVMVVADFGDYDSSNSPPVGVMIAGLLGLQPNYPERLGKAVLLDAPMWLHGIVTLLKPLLSETTRTRLIISGGTLDKLASYFYTSSKSITDIVHELVDESQAMPFLLPGGQLSTEMDPIVQVTTIPFFCLYDQGR